MREAAIAALIAGLLGLAPARGAEAACGDQVRLAVEPPAKADDVAAVLRRRLTAAGDAKPDVEAEAGGLKVALPGGLPESLLTRPARIEFRLVADKPDDAGAVELPRLDGKSAERVEPQIILDEARLRNVVVKSEPDPAGGTPTVALAFRLEPAGAKNLMAASAESIGRKLAIIVDDRIIADPIIRAPIASIEGEISGGFTPASAAELVDLLRSGRLPAHVSVLSRTPLPCASR